MTNHKDEDEAYTAFKEQCIINSNEKVKPFNHVSLTGWWECTDGQSFSSKEKAIDHQYYLERTYQA